MIFMTQEQIDLFLRELKKETEMWDTLSDEALENFENYH